MAFIAGQRIDEASRFPGIHENVSCGGMQAFVRHDVESFRRVARAESTLRRLAEVLTLRVPERRFCRRGG
ncbi:hypothetical protein DIE18_31485 [Burkholderia sp. Bp9125]|nr:hypothetical protein DIE18_31485 [Burkholderia sp. Bp9125]